MQSTVKYTRYALHQMAVATVQAHHGDVSRAAVEWRRLMDSNCSESEFERLAGPNYEEPKNSAVKLTCPACGSDEVRKDAIAAFNELKQAWEICGILDNGSCESCGADDIKAFVETIIEASPQEAG